MRVCIVTNLNGIGLTRDAEIISGVLTELGHEVTDIQYDAPLLEAKYDLAIFLEVLPRNLLDLAPIRWAFLNPEWVTPEILKTAQRHMDKIFAKTREGQRIFEPLFPGRTFYVGFAARDRYDETAIQEDSFLVLAGNSQIRGAQECLDAWFWAKDGKRIEAPLYIVARAPLKGDLKDSRIHHFTEVPDEMLKEMQNTCRFHLHFAQTEGYGHSLHESLSVNAEIVVTDAPPMDEVIFAHRIPVVGKTKLYLADLYQVSAIDIYKKVSALLTLGDRGLGKDGKPREEFIKNNIDFKFAFAKHFQEIAPEKPTPAPVYIKKKGSGLQVAFIGNFKPDHSTENQIRWALEEGLGHDVELLQENEVNLTAIQSAARFSDVLFWVRTAGWLRVPDKEMLEFLSETKIPTCSIHLDKFFGIPDREALIGVHPFWRTKFVFTADGSRQEDFAARGVNHFWMRPAVSEVFCHPGQPWDMYRCDVGFVGARDYHREYPFRGQMVDFLEKTYGARFKHFTGIRGHALNDVYASCRVVVGDCFQAGTPRYYSDRVPETMGRFGFLIHPRVEGMGQYVGTWYSPQNLESLQRAIESSLRLTEAQRKRIVRNCAGFVSRLDTWTVRMKEILEIVR